LALLIASPFIGVGAAWLWISPPVSTPSLSVVSSNAPVVEQYQLSFSECSGPNRHNCVVDGDTIWVEGVKVRIADINTPEVSSPKCPQEAALGARATRRLSALMNAGGFSLESVDRDEDGYGRKLRVVTREGESVGKMLVSEGLAEPWSGSRKSWC
jgi:endonuclease YncB( thermonuclease family)